MRQLATFLFLIANFSLASADTIAIIGTGDSDSAKKTVAALVEDMGLAAIDLGGIENAHWVEGMLILWLNNRYGPRESFDYYLRKTK